MAEQLKRAFILIKDEKLFRGTTFFMNRFVHALKRITGAARISLLYVQEIMLPGDLPMRRHKKPFSTVASLSSCVFLVLFPFKAGVFISAHDLIYYVLYYSKSVFDSSIIFSKNRRRHT